MQFVSAFEAMSLGPSDGVWSFMRAPGSAAALVAALEEAIDAGGGSNPSLIKNLLAAVTVPMWFILSRRLPAMDAPFAAWCAATLRAGALPVLRRLMAKAPFRGHAASAASIFALMAAGPVAAAAASAAAGGAGSDGTPKQPPDDAPRRREDPALTMALEILLGCLTGALGDDIW
jgi:hypothetical protein